MNLPTHPIIVPDWSGPPIMDGESTRTVEPTFDIGQRVLCPPTPGALDEDPYKAGGIGTVVRVTDIHEDGRCLLMVRLDSAPANCPEQPYNPCELKPAPTV